MFLVFEAQNKKQKIQNITNLPFLFCFVILFNVGHNTTVAYIFTYTITNLNQYPLSPIPPQTHTSSYLSNTTIQYK